MKSAFLTHGVWSCAAVGTFALGYLIAKPSDSGNDSSANRSLTVRNGNMAGASNPTAPGAARTAGLGTAGNPGAAARPAPLSPAVLEALAKEALSDPNPLTRSLAFARLLESMTPENAGTLLENLRANRAGGEQMQLFLYAWGAMDSTGVLAHAESLEGRDKERFLNSTIPGWASKDPTAAIAWLDTMEEGDAKNRYRSSLVAGLADHDIRVATSYVLARAAVGDQQAAQYMQTVAGEELRKNGPAAAALWGERLPEGAARSETLIQIAGAYVQRDPIAAAAWAEKFATTTSEAGIMEKIGKEWSERDPKSAVAWLNGLTDGPAKSEGTYSALREWTRRDPTAASEYLAALPPSPSKDSAVSGFARSLAREDPESAIIWAKTISNETSRVQTLTQAGQAWFRRDPTAATTWLQNSQLPDAAQQAILNPPRDDRGRRGG
jgi:hypothetical protein